ncbi:MAG: hypothetical protein H0W34_02190 [Pyrinomonadaceae bacterium]|nr:hypothetical protein [Pyrinomonadaceae bacterium]
MIFFRLTDAEVGARASEFCCIEIRRHVHLTHRRAKPAPGAQPVARCSAPAGPSHRRTSGGEAVPLEVFLADDETRISARPIER